MLKDRWTKTLREHLQEIMDDPNYNAALDQRGLVLGVMVLDSGGDTGSVRAWPTGTEDGEKAMEDQLADLAFTEACAAEVDRNGDWPRGTNFLARWLFRESQAKAGEVQRANNPLARLFGGDDDEPTH